MFDSAVFLVKLCRLSPNCLHVGFSVCIGIGICLGLGPCKCWLCACICMCLGVVWVWVLDGLVGVWVSKEVAVHF